MPTLNSLKDLKDQLKVAEEKEREVDPNELGEEEVEIEVEEKPAEQPEKPAEPEKKDDKPAEAAPQKTNADYARERREKRDREQALAAQRDEANRRADAMARQLEEARTPKRNDDPEPNKQEDRESWLEWNNRKLERQLNETRQFANQTAERVQKQERATEQERTVQSAREEAASFENDFRQSTPDYDQVKANYIGLLAASEKLRNPGIKNDQLVKSIDHMLLTRLGNYMNEGYDNPVAALYDEARQYYSPPVNKNEADEKPDLSAVGKVRSRNAGTVSPSGRGGGDLSLQSAAKMPVGEWAKLPVAEKRKLMYGK